MGLGPLLWQSARLYWCVSGPFPVPPKHWCHVCLTHCGTLGTEHQGLGKCAGPYYLVQSSSAGLPSVQRGERECDRLFLGTQAAQTGLCFQGAFFTWGHVEAVLTSTGGASAGGTDVHQTGCHQGARTSPSSAVPTPAELDRCRVLLMATALEGENHFGRNLS